MRCKSDGGEYLLQSIHMPVQSSRFIFRTQMQYHPGMVVDEGVPPSQPRQALDLSKPLLVDVYFHAPPTQTSIRVVTGRKADERILDIIMGRGEDRGQWIWLWLEENTFCVKPKSMV